MSTLDHTLEPKGATVRRLEVITGTGRRRRFSADDKVRIIEETLVPGAVVSDVARRHGLSPQQLFTWRRQARRPAVASAETEAPIFVGGGVRRRGYPTEAAANAACGSGLRNHRGRDRGCHRSGRPRRRCKDGCGGAARFAGRRMIGPTGAVRVMVATRPVDFRKGAEGLAALVREDAGRSTLAGRSMCSAPSARTG